MKKTLALILAAMMVAGTSAVAFAVEPSDVQMTGDVYRWSSDNSRYEKISNTATVDYGSKIAFTLTGSVGTEIISDSDEVRNVKVYPEYKVGEALVAAKPTIQYRKVYTAPVAEVAHYELKKETGELTVATGSGLTGALYTAQATLDGKKFVLPTTLTVEEMTNADKFVAAFTKANKDGSTHETDAAAILADTGAKAALIQYVVTDLETNAVYEKKVDTAAVAESTTYRYVVEMELNDSTTTATKDLFGTMRVGRTSTSAEANDDADFNLTVKHNGDNSGTDYFSVDTDNENYVIDFDGCDICDIEFVSTSGNSYALFTVDASGQGKENVGFSVKFNSEIAAKYPEANLEFLSFTASPVFNRTGELSIYAPEDSFIYEVTADGLKEIKNAEYDESSEAWVMKTRYLKSYVTSDVELDLSKSEEASSSETSSSNPVTGGTTGTTGGNTNVKPNPNTGR